MKKEDIEIFIDGIENPAEPNQALIDAAERLKGKELFKESNDRARKILSEIKSLPIQEISYSEEEVLELLNNLRLYSYSYGMGRIEFLEWFKQFKKK